MACGCFSANSKHHRDGGKQSKNAGFVVKRPIRKLNGAVIQNQKEDIDRRCGRKLATPMQDINSLIERFYTFANNVQNDQRTMDLQAFKETLGILGNFQISDRMFSAIDEDKDGFISLEDYLVYNDILSYGTE
jgi:hypothetical protein